MTDEEKIEELKKEIERLQKRLEVVDRGCWNCAIGKFMNDIEEKSPKLHSIITENVCTKCTDIFYRDHEFWVKDTQGNRLQETKKALEIHSDRYNERWEEPFKEWEEEHDI